MVKRQEISLEKLVKFLKKEYDLETITNVEIELKYEGYINKTKREIEKMNKMENKKIPKDIDYYKIHNIATEAKQKLTEVKPLNIGQASRISGVNPSDIAILIMNLKNKKI